MEQQIKSFALENGDVINVDDYIGRSVFEEDILEYICDKTIEYYAMNNLELNTEDYHLENAWENDLVDALEDLNYNFLSKASDDEITEEYHYRGLGIDELRLDIVSQFVFNSVVDVFSRGDINKIKEIEKIINN